MMNEKLNTCVADCHTEEECISCYETHKQDIQNCPCGKNCQGLKNNSLFYFKYFISAGCPCAEFDCSILDDFAESCNDPINNENYQSCAQVQEDDFIECVHNCDGPTCSQNCAAQYSLAIENCPCAKNCPCKFES